jgi:excisionase family DNA binding protein
MDKALIAPKLISVQGAAAALGISVWTVRAWAYAGKISSNKLGKRLMVSSAEIDRIIAESERPRLEKKSSSPKALPQ